MAINFPTSLDNFTNPASGNTLNSPSHSLQHSDLNDAVEALEAKVGIGASPAGSATSGQVLTAQGGGTALWATPTAGGLVHISTTTFSSAANQAIDSVFSSTYNNYKVIWTFTLATRGNGEFKFRTGGTDNSSTTYNRSGGLFVSNSSTISSYNGESEGTGNLDGLELGANILIFEIASPFASERTAALIYKLGANGTAPLNRHAYLGVTFNNTTSFDGMKLFPPSNMTGRVQVFGYKQ